MKYKYIALLTDFGLKDNFVGVMKGVIKSINPAVEIIDITHEVESHNIMAGMFVLKSAWQYFPEKTIFLCVVDPGVGTERKIICIKKEKYIFIAPDNGLLSFIEGEIFELDINKLKPQKISWTFHGRDLFAPFAAKLSKGIKLTSLCRKIENIKKFELPQPQIKKNRIIAEIIYIDKFGNCTLNISGEFIKSYLKKGFVIKLKGRKITGLCRSYYEVKKGVPGAIINSFDYLELFMREDSISKKMKLKRGSKIEIRIKNKL